MVVLFDIYQFKACGPVIKTKNKKKTKQNKTKTEQKQKQKTKQKQKKKPKTKARSPARSLTCCRLHYFPPQRPPPSFKLVAVEMASCTVFPPGP